MMKRKIVVLMTLTICLMLPSSAFSGDALDTVHWVIREGIWI
jgi:hypothetical protein